MKRISTYDRKSGTLKYGHFYELCTSGSAFEPLLPREKRRRRHLGIPTDRSNWIVREYPHESHDYGWCELVRGDRKVVKRCPSCDEPVEYQRVPNVFSADLFGGRGCEWSGLVYAFMFDDLVVSGRLRSLLSESGLKGYSLHPIKIECDQTDSEHTPELYCLIRTGGDCYRDETVTVPEPNTCPFCGTGPVVCPTCKRLVGCRSCINCKRKIVFYDDEKVDQCETRCFLTESLMDNEPIIEGAKWDGSDFLWVAMGVHHVVTARTIDFFCQNDVRRFAAWPIAVNIEGMSDEQKAALTTCHFARG